MSFELEVPQTEERPRSPARRKKSKGRMTRPVAPTSAPMSRKAGSLDVVNPTPVKANSVSKEKLERANSLPSDRPSSVVDEGLIQASLRKFVVPLCKGVIDAEPAVYKVEFTKALEHQGLCRSDPRLTRMFSELDESGDQIPVDDMVDIAGLGGQTVFDALSAELVIPKFAEFRDECRRMFDEVSEMKGGAVSTWIPQTARVDPTKFAMSVTTVDGQTFSFGDFEEHVCMQSVAKPITYCMAAEEHGLDHVHRYVGREPSGSSSKAIKLKPVDATIEGRKVIAIPYNPLTNSGALVCTSMIQTKSSMADRMDSYLSTCSALCAAKVGFDPAVMVSERSVSDRNTALAFMCKGSGAFPDEHVDLQETIELYNATCATTATPKMISSAAATLANGGVNPMTGHAVFDPEVTRAALSLMLSCGMYDSSGEWAFDIGLPAKSSISGLLMLVVPNVMGICIYSPTLDDRGLPLKGVELTKKLVDTFAFHHLDSIGGSSSKKSPTAKPHMTETELMFAIMCAAAQGDVMAIQQHIGYGGNVRVGDYDRRTPLHVAASQGHLDTVEYLLTQGADVEAQDRYGNTAFDDAIRGQKLQEAVPSLPPHKVLPFAEIAELLSEHVWSSTGSM